MRKKMNMVQLLTLGLTGFLTVTPVQAEEKVASAQEMTTVDQVLEDWMVPVPVEDLVEGTYEVEVKCSSSMFKIDRAVLEVESGQARACLYMNSTSYLYVYPGQAQEAAMAPQEDYLPFKESQEEGVYFVTLPVEQLDAVTKCAAFSRKKEKWYDRDLVFLSTSLPDIAFPGGRGTGVEELSLEDGNYLVEALLSGGSGRTTIESPARLRVEGGEATLTVVFSSPNYDYMLIGDERYEPIQTEGNSTFEIPVSGFDTPLPVVADTVAMSKPHEISYTITLDSATLKAAQE